MFIDLEKAFDRVVRELLWGFPARKGAYDTLHDKVDYLKHIGVEHEPAEKIASFVHHRGALLEQLEVDKKVQNIISALYAQAWFRYDDLPTAVSSTRGGRQGCKLGAHIFNAIYQVALAEVRDLLAAEGVIPSIPFMPDTPFWSHEDAWDNAPHIPLLDVTFVDDEAIAFITPHTWEMERALPILTTTFQRVFASYGLTINWRRGKSEGMMRLRGKLACTRWDRMEHRPK